MALDAALLTDRLATLAAVRAWPAALVPALQDLLTTAPDEQLIHLNPRTFAAAHTLPENAVIDAWLHATRLGVLAMRWHVLCLQCGNLTNSFNHLNHLHGHFICRMCAVETDGHLDDSILATFVPHPEVRSTRFHHPETLSVAERYRTYLSPDLLPFSDGRDMQTVEAANLVFWDYLAPGATITVDTVARPGMFYLTSLLTASLLKMRVAADQSPATSNVQVALINGKFQSLTPPMAPRRTNPHDGYPGTYADQFAILPPGPLHIEITNRGEQRAAMRLELIDHTYPKEPLRYRPFLTGKQLLTSQTFRELFRAEAPPEEENLAVRALTFLFTDLKDSTALYETVGDPQAYLLVRQHFQLLTRLVAEHQGAIVKTIGDAIMATFATPLAGVQAALAMQTALAEFNQLTSAALTLKIGLHAGPSILVAQNERLDYFGQTVNIAARALGTAAANEIVLTETLYTAPGVAEALANWQVTPTAATLRGVQEEQQLYHITR